jgi:putative transposase
MGGIARTNGMKALAVGGTRDHVHLLISLPPTMAVAKAMQLIKSGSSKWMHDKIALDVFQWQEKYGAFSIGISQVERTIGYIKNQKKHHAKIGSAQEWKAILKRHGLPVKNEQPSLAGLFSIFRFPGTCCAACRAIFIRASGAGCLHDCCGEGRQAFEACHRMSFEANRIVRPRKSLAPLGTKNKACGSPISRLPNCSITNSGYSSTSTNSPRSALKLAMIFSCCAAGTKS